LFPPQAGLQNLYPAHNLLKNTMKNNIAPLKFDNIAQPLARIGQGYSPSRLPEFTLANYVLGAQCDSPPKFLRKTYQNNEKQKQQKYHN